MNKVIHLSLSRKSVPVFMDIVQGTTAPAIEFILDDYTPPSNARARIYIKKDGGEVYNNCTLSGNVVTYTPTAGSFDVAGQCVAQLELVQSSTVAVSWRIFVTVEPNLISGSSAPASTEFGALTELIQDAQRYDTIIGSNNLVGANNRQGWTALTSGQDLNTVTTPGVYVCYSDAIAQSLLNCPTTNAFRMMVGFTRNVANNLFQRIELFSNANQERKFERHTQDASTWASWFMFPLRSEVNAIANRGGKNLLPNTGTSTTINGVTFTVNADGSVTVNGTATATADYYGMAQVSLGSGTFALSGCPEGGSEQTYFLGVRVNNSWSASGKDYGDGKTVTGEITRWAITIRSGYTADNLTFYPMLRDASIQDDTYVPYGMSNAELTEELTLKVGTVTPVEGATTNNLMVYEKGGVVTINGYMTAPSSVGTSGVIIGTISGVDLPNAQIRAVGNVGTNAYSAKNLAYVSIGTNGDIAASAVVANAGTVVFFSASYIRRG